jgi:hypothetical protein
MSAYSRIAPKRPNAASGGVSKPTDSIVGMGAPSAVMAPSTGQAIGGALGRDVESLRGPARGSAADWNMLRTGASVSGWR